MKQVKVFRSIDTKELEKQINEWLLIVNPQNFIIHDIKYQTTFIANSNYMNYSALIIYTKPNEEKI